MLLSKAFREQLKVSGTNRWLLDESWPEPRFEFRDQPAGEIFPPASLPAWVGGILQTETI
jgi:hypothetical protein